MIFEAPQIFQIVGMYQGISLIFWCAAIGFLFFSIILVYIQTTRMENRNQRRVFQCVSFFFLLYGLARVFFIIAMYTAFMCVECYDFFAQLGYISSILGVFFFIFAIENYILKQTKRILSSFMLTALIVCIITSMIPESRYFALTMIYILLPFSLVGVLLFFLYLIKINTGSGRKRALWLLSGMILLFTGHIIDSEAFISSFPEVSLLLGPLIIIISCFFCFNGYQKRKPISEVEKESKKRPNLLKNIPISNIAIILIFILIIIIIFNDIITWMAIYYNPYEIAEIFLWFFSLGVCFFTVIYLILLARKSELEAKHFFIGTSIFWLAYGIARLIENTRRYIVGSYTDIVNGWISGDPITGLNFGLRISYYIIAWTGLTIFFWNIEKYIFVKNKFSLTVICVVEGAVSIITNIFLNPITYWIAVFLYFIIGYFPVILFLYLGKRTPKGRIRKGCLLAATGIFFFATSVLLDLPETAYFAYLFSIDYSEFIVRIAAPITLPLGVFLFTLGFKYFFTEAKIEDEEKDIMKAKIPQDVPSTLVKTLARAKPKEITEEEVMFYKAQKICLVCKSKVSGFSYICSECDALYCEKCAKILVTLENACWVCNNPIDKSKPSTPYEMEELDEGPSKDALEKKGKSKTIIKKK
jgi:hypothetical protein